MDLSTLFSANVLLLSIFAISFLSMSFRVTPHGHWRSWATANALLAAALVCFAFERQMPILAAYLVPNALLLLAFGFHWHAARQLAHLPSKISSVIAPAATYLLVASIAFQISNYALAYTASNVIFTVLCITTIWAFASKSFEGLISAVGLILAFVFIAAEGVLRTAYGLATDGPTSPGLMSDTIQDVHLLCMLLFVSMTGAFSLAISFEQIAQRHKEAARRDPLTGTFNRREFQSRLDELLHTTPKDNFGLVHFDLDYFKQVNDRFGHVAGDQALVKICSSVKTHLRQDDCFARLGGEEFAVLLPDISRENAFKVADRLRERISDLRFEFAPDNFQITASAGIYHGDGSQLASTDLQHTVDKGLYQSKNDGRNRVTFAEPQVNSALT
jgi:diguanylate cyclase (GGDEF)-like protein